MEAYAIAWTAYDFGKVYNFLSLTKAQEYAADLSPTSQKGMDTVTIIFLYHKKKKPFKNGRLDMTRSSGVNFFKTVLNGYHRSGRWAMAQGTKRIPLNEDIWRVPQRIFSD